VVEEEEVLFSKFTQTVTDLLTKPADTTTTGFKKASQVANDPIGTLKAGTDAGKALGESTGIPEVVRKGPGGELKTIVDMNYGGSLKEGIESSQSVYREFEDALKYTDEKSQEVTEAFHTEKDKFLDDPTGALGLDKPLEELGEAVHTILTENGDGDETPEERERRLQQGQVLGGGRKALYGRKAMSTGTSGASILAP